MKTSDPNRVDRSRWARIAVFAAGLLFSIQIFLAGYAAPAFSEMFVDFGSELPVLTRVVLSVHFLWYFMGLAGVVWSAILYRWSGRGSVVSFRVGATVAALAFVLGQTLVVAFFLPALQLSQLQTYPTEETSQ